MDMIKSLLSDFDVTALLPDLPALFGGMEAVLRLAVMAGPLCMLGLGLFYLLLPPAEANHNFGYRCFWAMSSVEAWRFTQFIAGATWTVLGLVLTVVMGLICNGHRDLSWEAMVWSALWAVVAEIAVVAISIALINVALLFFFDRKGIRRSGE